MPTRVTYVGSGDDEEVIEYFGPPKHTGDAANTAKNSAGQASKDSNRSVSEWNSDDHRTTTSAADNENIVSLDDDFRLSEDIIAIQMDNNDDFFNEKPPVASSRSNSMSPNKRSSSPRAQSFKDDSLEGYVQITDGNSIPQRNVFVYYCT